MTNTGARAGSEVVQVYVEPPTGGADRPPRELRGFAKLHLGPGESGEATFELGVLAISPSPIRRAVAGVRTPGPTGW